MGLRQKMIFVLNLRLFNLFYDGNKAKYAIFFNIIAINLLQNETN